jgi:hypothetical protein
MCTTSVTRLVTVKKKRKFFSTYLGGIVPWVTTKIPREGGYQDSFSPWVTTKIPREGGYQDSFSTASTNFRGAYQYCSVSLWFSLIRFFSLLPVSSTSISHASYEDSMD